MYWDNLEAGVYGCEVIVYGVPQLCVAIKYNEFAVWKGRVILSQDPDRLVGTLNRLQTNGLLRSE